MSHDYDLGKKCKHVFVFRASVGYTLNFIRNVIINKSPQIANKSYSHDIWTRSNVSIHTTTKMKIYSIILFPSIYHLTAMTLLAMVKQHCR